MGLGSEGEKPRGSAYRNDSGGAQLDAKRRFETAVAEAGSGLADILWPVVCAGEGMREAESALSWPARAGKLALGIALGPGRRSFRIA